MVPDNKASEILYSLNLPHMAREAISSHLRGSRGMPSNAFNGGDAFFGVFVTLRDRAHALRGCVGFIQPLKDNLITKLKEAAVAAAVDDTRFRELTLEELEAVKIEVSLLHKPEQVKDKSELNPKEWGIIVSDGQRRGLLLPDIEGVEDAGQQIAIAKDKAGLPAGATDFSMERFRVSKFCET